MPTELPWVDCGPLGLNGDRPTSGSSARDETRDRSSRGVDAVGSSHGSGDSSFARRSASRLLLLGLCSCGAEADASCCAASRYSWPIPGKSTMLFCTCRSGAASATLLKGCTSVLAVMPAGRPKLAPSASDKVTVVVIPSIGGNSGTAEVSTPSAASGSSFIVRPVSSFRVLFARMTGSRSSI